MKFSSDFLHRLRKIFISKYVLVILIFLGFLTFSGSYSLIDRFKRSRNIRTTEKEIEFYRSEIEANKNKMNEMRASPASLEKYAREQYYLKKDSEDIYIIKEDDEKK